MDLTKNSQQLKDVPRFWTFSAIKKIAERRVSFVPDKMDTEYQQHKMAVSSMAYNQISKTSCSSLEQSDLELENRKTNYTVNNKIELAREGATLPLDCYFPGQVTYTSEDGIMNMRQQGPSINSGTSGCIVDEMQKELFNKNEVIVPLIMQHPNITPFIELIQRDYKEGYQLTERILKYAGVSLNQYLCSNSLTKHQIRELASQGLQVLSHLDLNRIVHLNVNPENVSIQTMHDRLLVMKFTDFGSSKRCQDLIQLNGHPLEYMSPEMCKRYLQFSFSEENNISNWLPEEMEITGKSDCYGWALVIMFMYKRYHILVKLVTNGQESYQGIDEHSKSAIAKYILETTATDPEFLKYFIPDECDLDMRELLQMLIKYNHQERWNANEALKYITDREWKLSPKQQGHKMLLHEHGKRDRMEYNDHTDGHGFRRMQDIPSIAVNAMEKETGPVKSSILDELRRKIESKHSNH